MHNELVLSPPCVFLLHLGRMSLLLGTPSSFARHHCRLLGGKELQQQASQIHLVGGTTVAARHVDHRPGVDRGGVVGWLEDGPTHLLVGGEGRAGTDGLDITHHSLTGILSGSGGSAVPSSETG